jgi:RimJ/RimL family protein N-acetyltransferase
MAEPITLRPLAETDIDDVVTAGNDPESARWTTVPAPYTRADAVAFVQGRTRQIWNAGDGAVFAIAGPDGRFAGSIHLEISPEDPAVGSIGYLITPAARGRGYATAAVRTICSWGFEALGLTRIGWRAYVGNTASRRVAEKCGFVMEGIARAGCNHRGERRDAWVAALLATDIERCQAPRLMTP